MTYLSETIFLDSIDRYTHFFKSVIVCIFLQRKIYLCVVSILFLLIPYRWVSKYTLLNSSQQNKGFLLVQ